MTKEITIFAKRRKTKEGNKTFTQYLTTMTTKEGEERTMSVVFKEGCAAPKPDSCPCIIEFEKKDGNVSRRRYVREDTGEDAYSYTLWLDAYKLTDKAYVDTSMDEYF